MQEKNFDHLLSNEFAGLTGPKLKKESTKLALKNEEDLSQYASLPNFRVPTPAELVEIRSWAIDYRKANKRASKRAVRLAVQTHFNIKIIK